MSIYQLFEKKKTPDDVYSISILGGDLIMLVATSVIYTLLILWIDLRKSNNN